MSATVQRLIGYEITDSNGNPTIEVELTLSNGFKVRSGVSSDNVINTFGRKELRDHDMQHYQGLGVKTALTLINTHIAPRLVNLSVGNQLQIDNWIQKSDGTEDSSKLGINTMMVLSQVFAKAAAYTLNIPLYKYIAGYYQQLTKEPITLEKIPTPVIAALSGGKHAEFESFEFLPSSSMPFSQAYEMCIDLYHSLQTIFDQNSIEFSKNYSGEFIPNKNANTDMIESMLDAVQRKGLKLGKHIFLGLKINANAFYSHGRYTLHDRPTSLTQEDYYNYVSEIIGKYSVLMLEDPFATEDIDGWRKLFVNMGEQIYILGHKYLGDNMEIVESMDTQKTLTGMVFKPSYFGTITAAMKVINRAKKQNVPFVISSDRGETNDDFIADFGMGVQADFLKFGAPNQGERIAKYNRLLKIEQEARMLAAAQQSKGGTQAEQKAPAQTNSQQSNT
ncbi:MAG: hypothetical protein ACOCXQ_00905 [Patescibacteria group bacterium]